jgi:5-methylthioadenosine/S-adenosylhomocysteine deaminase
VKPDDLTSDAVVFLDLIGTLVAAGGGGRFSAIAQSEPWLISDNRRGVLCNLGPRREARDILRILEDAELDAHFESDLLIAASNLPHPLPDRRAFSVAAALAEVPPDQCVFVSDDPAMRSAAAAAGMRAAARSEQASTAPGSAGQASAAELQSGAEEPRATLAADEVDEDVGPTFVLTGRVVTMNSAKDVYDDGQVAISRGLIAAVCPHGQALPAEFANAPRIETNGTLYPGLIDLHNHFVYNVLTLWTVPKLYEDRSQWPRARTYPAEVTLPVRALAETPRTARALVRYVEAKALIGGTTTGQGIRTRVNGGPKLFRGAMRNVEVTSDARLPEAGTRVPSLYVNPERVAAFRRSLDSRTAYFYHLAEGVNDAARGTFTDLLDNDLLQPSLVGIHCLGLQPDDLTKFTAAGAKAVWSPLSNLLLYGKTLDLKALAASKVQLAIGCDWSPSGSKNLLQELKVARWVADEQQAELSDADLVSCVTSTPASILGWAPYLGALTENAFADVLVLTGDDGDPYEQLVRARESDIQLLFVHGVARYGESEPMEKLHTTPEFPLETWMLGRSSRAFNLRTPDSELNDLGLASATATLSTAMGDLPTLRAQAETDGAQLASFGVEAPSFTVDLDNEYEPTPDELLEGGAAAALMADWSQMAASVALDTPVVGGDEYWKLLDAASNLPDGLAASLRDSYGG